uniref:Secreted protein n=1 Tax=Macrostomum lignano TaxID=282301 RepID=A0A1I8G666_9PLAT
MTFMSIQNYLLSPANWILCSSGVSSVLLKSENSNNNPYMTELLQDRAAGDSGSSRRSSFNALSDTVMNFFSGSGRNG